MGYVAVKGGTEAINNAKELVEFYRVRDNTKPIEVAQLKAQFRLAIDKIMGEGSFYAPEYGALALKQVEGDVLEAAFIMRAYRATLSRKYFTDTIDTENMFVLRRISSSFREIPGGQILGPTRDYTQRLIDTRLVEEKEGDFQTFVQEFLQKLDGGSLEEIKSFNKVINILKEQGLVQNVVDDEETTLVDVTREAIKFPAPRSARLQMLARAETGGVMSIGYASMRGHGAVHPTVGELRVGKVKLRLTDNKGRNRYIGKINVTEAEMISKSSSKQAKGVPHYSIGYGLCFGQNETKAICMGILDRAMRMNSDTPPSDQEFVLYHTEGIEAMGFTNHLKLPHYVTFQSGLSNLREAMKRSEEATGDEKKSKMELEEGLVNNSDV